MGRDDVAGKVVPRGRAVRVFHDGGHASLLLPRVENGRGVPPPGPSDRLRPPITPIAPRPPATTAVAPVGGWARRWPPWPALIDRRIGGSPRRVAAARRLRGPRGPGGPNRPRRLARSSPPPDTTPRIPGRAAGSPLPSRRLAPCLPCFRDLPCTAPHRRGGDRPRIPAWITPATVLPGNRLN